MSIRHSFPRTGSDGGIDPLTFLLLTAAFACAGPMQAATPDRPMIGVSYFAGWWRPLPNKWNYDPAVGDWRARFPQRVPLLGEYNEQPTMDKEIVAAAEHGVDFFLILWYYNGPDDSREREKNARFLNEGVKTFVKSPEAHRMRFAIEYCNHEPYQVKSADDWSHCTKTWTAAMRHPSYLRVGGRLVFKVHSWHHFWDENGKDAKACRARLDGLRKAVREAGLGEMIVGCGIASGEKIVPGHLAGDLFDFTGTYMEVPNLPQRTEDYPYEKLAEFARPTRGIHAGDKIPYVPYLGAGFNARPWPDNRARFAIPSKDEWTRELRTMKADLERLKNLGFPLPDGRRQKALTIYAWNEFGEGGFLAPTKGEGTMKLQAIQEVFGRVRIAGIVLKSNDWILQARSRETGLPIVFVHPLEFLVTGPNGSVLQQTIIGDVLLIPPAEAGTAKDANRVFCFDLPAHATEKKAR